MDHLVHFSLCFALDIIELLKPHGTVFCMFETEVEGVAMYKLIRYKLTSHGILHCMWSADISKNFSHYSFQQIFSMGSASWTLDPCKDDKTYHSHKKRKDSLETRAEPTVFSL